MSEKDPKSKHRKSAKKTALDGGKTSSSTDAPQRKAIVPGCKAKMWKQDPGLLTSDIAIVFLPSIVKRGPSDDQIKIIPPEDHEAVEPDANGDLHYIKAATDIVAFEMVHCFATARIVLNMFERLFRTIDSDYMLMWNWYSPSYLKIKPRAGKGTLPRYIRKDKSIECYSCEFDGKMKSIVGFDLLAHEIGLAFLDGLKPEWADSTHVETLAISQSFADLTVVFALLTQIDVCELLLCQTKGDLHKKNFLCMFAEEFGQMTVGGDCLRNLHNEFKYKKNCSDVSYLSLVLSGCIYDILADFFVVYQNPLFVDVGEALAQVGKMIRQMFFLSIWSSSDHQVTFKELGERFLFYCLEKKWESAWVDLVRAELVSRDIIEA